MNELRSLYKILGDTKDEFLLSPLLIHKTDESEALNKAYDYIILAETTIKTALSYLESEAKKKVN